MGGRPDGEQGQGVGACLEGVAPKPPPCTPLTRPVVSPSGRMPGTA